MKLLGYIEKNPYCEYGSKPRKKENKVVPGSLTSQAQSDTPCSFSRFDADTPPRRKPQVSTRKKSMVKYRESLASLIF